jgi:hypothetical protein
MKNIAPGRGLAANGRNVLTMLVRCAGQIEWERR